MRVATRRQRAAWRVFGDAYDDKRTRRPSEPARARWRAGWARSAIWTSSIEHLDDYAQTAARGGADGTRAAARQPGATRRDEARGAADQGARQPQATWTGSTTIAIFVQTEGRGDTRRHGQTVPHRVRDTVPSAIWAAYQRVPRLRAGPPLGRRPRPSTSCASPAKWLRYTLEFVREALGPGLDAADRPGRPPSRITWA